jgi:hypothetical protein
MTKEKFVKVVLPQFIDEGDKLVIENGNIKFLKVVSVGHVTISELTAEGEYREYYKQEKKKKR